MAANNTLETLNSLNGMNATIDVRILNPESHEVPGKDFSLFTCNVVGLSGWYTIAEAYAYGNEQEQKLFLQGLEKKFKHNTTGKYPTTAA